MLEQVSSDIYEIESDYQLHQPARRAYFNRNRAVRDPDLEISNAEASQSYRKDTTKSGKSRKESVRNSTARYRDKKKKELQDLESEVKDLQEELLGTDSQIQKIKQSILKALEEKAKGNQLSATHDNLEIFMELESMVERSSEPIHTVEIDIDKINLLLDTLKYRIGASGRERQAKIDYNFKNIINTMFPALYRYILSTAVNQVDLFSHSESSKIGWTRELLGKLGAKPEQILSLSTHRSKLVNFSKDVMAGIVKLKDIKQRMKEEAMRVQKIQGNYRQVIDSIQCAQWILFAQRHKYRQQLSLDHSFMEEVPFSALGRPRKKVKQQQL